MRINSKSCFDSHWRILSMKGFFFFFCKPVQAFFLSCAANETMAFQTGLPVYSKLLPTFTGLKDPRLNWPEQCKLLTYRIFVKGSWQASKYSNLLGVWSIDVGFFGVK